MIKYLAVLLTISTCSISQGAELFETNQSVRALGMGNAYTTVVDDKDSLFYNPAGLSKIEGINWTFIGIRAGANGIEAAQDANEARDETKLFDVIRRYYGKNLWAGLGAKAALTLPGFAFAAYDSAEISAYLSNPAFPSLNLRVLNDYGFATGIGFSLLPGVDVGFVANRITRFGSAFPIGVSTLGSLSNEELRNQISNQGTGYSGSFGVNFTLPTPVKPTFSFVWKNIGQTTFTKDSGQRAPPVLLDEMVAGFGVLIDLPGIDIRPSLDVKHINKWDEQAGKKIHFGTEISLPFIDLRGGIHQGYYTAGVGVDLEFLRVDAATYGVELGEYPGQLEDRRYVVEATLELGFNPSFSFLKGSGGSRKGLKRRR